MCGIAGFWDKNYQVVEAQNMINCLTHRGPDDSGIWTSRDDGLSLAHSRLSIIELSKAGAQPMTSHCGRFVLIFNGEIYNHHNIRTNLEKEIGLVPWRGSSDTETILTGLSYWGIRRCLKNVVGMFALALWDKKKKTLILARDRMGEKPLYYGKASNSFLFGSELKAMRAFSNWRGEIDRDALALFFRYGYVPAPWSIYENIYKLPPAHYLIIKDQGREISNPISYWSLDEVASDKMKFSVGTENEMIDELELLLSDAVKRQMSADVPLGAFLSGGYDSSLITALMQSHSKTPIKTFSIGFNEVGFDESNYAEQVAKHLGTDHTDLLVTSNDALDVVSLIPEIYDEPFADASQIPTYLVSKLASNHVKVCLSGDGGDELFCGYNRYITGYNIWKKSQSLPYPARKILSTFLNNIPENPIEKFQWLIPKNLRFSALEDKLPKLADALLYSEGSSYYRSLISHSKNPTSLVLGSKEPEILVDTISNSKLFGLQEKMMFWDMINYLPNDILTKVDRASMASSLEARVPLLDHRVVEFAWKVPNIYKYRNGRGKWLLRQVIYRYLPKELMDRPKMGFSVPIGQWLRGPLRDWAETLLDESRLRREGFLNPQIVLDMWSQHVTGKRNWQHPLWDILIFQSWLEEQEK